MSEVATDYFLSQSQSSQVERYKAEQHNVVAVRDPVAYSLCHFPPNATTYSSGDDRVTLAGGMTFFLCGVSDHCTEGMKMAVTAS
ncbi:hypothetical protein E2562_003764 [Oryza meyeriana var. granulata]|uniref:Phytocyanin domain-containing protein n=1 Tax=Oryza meyeriana var. granulata TaxID=110450 RepID=A0A6G1BRD6_9ORYZ|nr:hypothetical protein E2562_003764 [Oryza meyeriana var. granulata]